MSEIVDYVPIKIKAQRTVLEDGLLEIVMGVYLVLSGVFLMNRAIILNYIWLPVGLALVEVIRRKYIFPRTGYAKLKIPIREIFIILAVSLIGMLLIGFMMVIISPDLDLFKGGWNGVVSYLLAILTTVFFCALAYRFDLPRWYLHGILFGLTFILYRSIKAPTVVFGLGAIIIIIGAIVFVDFLRRNPIPDRDAAAKKETNDAR